MKKLIVCFVMIMMIRSSFGQKEETQQLLLNVEKLAQLAQILSNMKKGYEVVSKGYTTIKDISQGNFKLHETFLDKLMQVSPVVRRYKKVGDIINAQLILSKEYKVAFLRFNNSGLFNDKEIHYLSKVYGNLFQQSLRNLDELMMVITAGRLRMSDDERIAAIDRIFSEMEDMLNFLRSFNKGTDVLALQRQKEMNEAKVSGRIYGLK